MQLSCYEGNICGVVYVANLGGHVEETKEPIGPVELLQPSLDDGPATGT